MNKYIERKYNFVYLTKNLINDKIYVGVHSTDRLTDGYLGSGVLIKRAIKKYGRKNFKRLILEFFDNFEDALQLEKNVVNEIFVDRDDTYNLKLGGECGHRMSEADKQHLSRIQIERFSNQEERDKQSQIQIKLWANDEYKKKMLDIFASLECREAKSKGIKKWIRENPQKHMERMLKINKNPIKIQRMADTHRNMKRSDETRKKQSLAKRKFIEENGTEAFGKGMIYIHNVETQERKRVDSNYEIPDGWKRGSGKYKKRKTSGLKMYIKSIDGNNERMIFKTDEIPNGWVKGRKTRGRL